MNERSTERLYLNNLFLGNSESVTSESVTITNEEPIEEKWRKSKLYTINKYIEELGIMNDADILLIDTAPLHVNSSGSKDLIEECKVWVGQSLIDKLNDRSKENLFGVELLKTWIQIVVINQESTIAPFQHPSFTGVIPIDEWSCWNRSYSDTECKNCENSYLDLLTKQKFEPSNYLGTYSTSNQYFTTSLGELKVPEIQNYYKKLNKEVVFIEELTEILNTYQCKSFFDLADTYNNNPDIRQDISDCMRTDLDCRHLAMNRFVDNKFAEVIIRNIKDSEKYNRGYSTLSGLPLWLHQDRKLDGKIINNELPSLYKGGAWMYVLFRDRQKYENQKENINFILKLTWLLYVDPYAFSATEGKGDRERIEIQNVFGHEIKYLGLGIAGNWLAKPDNIFDFSAEIGGQYSNVLRLNANINEEDIELFRKSKICYVPKLFARTGKSLKRWSMTDDIRDFAQNLLFSDFVRECFKYALEDLEVFLFNTSVTSDIESAKNSLHLYNQIEIFFDLLLKSLYVSSENDINIDLLDIEEKLVWIARLLMSAMKNIVQHGDWTREISISVGISKNKCKITLKNFRRGKSFREQQIKFIRESQFFCELEEKWQLDFIEFLEVGFNRDKIPTAYTSSHVIKYCLEQLKGEDPIYHITKEQYIIEIEFWL